MKSAHLLASFYFEPWNLRPDIHANFSRILQKHIAGEPVAERLTPARLHALAAPHAGQPIVGPSDPWGNPYVPQMAVESGVAVIPIYGALGKRLDSLELRCGGCDYDNISEFAAMAATDPTISTVILDLDSPGGSCRGLPECFDVLQDLGQRKNLIAYSEGTMCSAAYYLACAAGEIYASPSASVGNIGTVLAAQDTSREWEMNGWRVELFASGALKGIGFDGKAWTSAERDFFSGWMQKKFAEFKGVVTESRPEIAPECFDGRWLDGDICPAYGLTDGVAMNLQTLVAAALMAPPARCKLGVRCFSDPAIKHEFVLGLSAHGRDSMMPIENAVSTRIVLEDQRLNQSVIATEMLDVECDPRTTIGWKRTVWSPESRKAFECVERSLVEY